jgi:hypothetical protein
MARVGLVLGVVLAGLFAGCLDTAPSEILPEEPPRELGTVFAEIQAPRSLYTRGELGVKVEAPDGTVREGTKGTHYEDFLLGLPTREWPGRYSGDVRPEEPGVVGPYAYMLFENVSYNGTWLVTFTLIASSDPAEDATGIDGNVAYCARVILSEPDKVPIEGRYSAARVFYSDAVLRFDWAADTWHATPTAGDGCNTEPSGNDRRLGPLRAMTG